MNRFRLRLSLRYKLLFLLTALPVASLALYLFIATDLFQKDKVAYVFDSSATVSRSLATQMRIEMDANFNSLRTLVEQFDFKSSSFNPVASDIFQRNKKTFGVLLFKRSPSGAYVKLGQLVKGEPGAESFASNVHALARLRDLALKNGAAILQAPSGTVVNGVMLGFLLGELNDPDHLLMMALVRADDLVGAFEVSSLYTNYLVTRNGQLALGDQENAQNEIRAYNSILKSKAGEGTAEMKSSSGAVNLVSYSAVGMGDLLAISTVDKSQALKAVDVLIAKSLLFFVALIAFTLIVSVIASGQLTASLRELFEATGKIAQGDFSVRVVARSSDEVGGLATSFNFMAEEVSRLMMDTAEKARMQGELATVKTVQETLFPASRQQFGNLQIRGHFEPASECGGDWWSYCRIGDKIFLWVGDATGHGAPAALITSAARSAAAVIESLPDMTPARAMTILNKAINMTSKGQILMTFFIASIDLKEETLTYSCASHDPPYLIKNSGQKIVKRDLKPLNDVNGPRLGDNKDFVYEETKVDFKPGDMVFFYTDGILDVQNAKGEKWSERIFLKLLVDSANIDQGVDGKLENVRDQLNAYRESSDLIDDVTMVFCEFDRKAG